MKFIVDYLFRLIDYQYSRNSQLCRCCGACHEDCGSIARVARSINRLGFVHASSNNCPRPAHTRSIFVKPGQTNRQTDRQTDTTQAQRPQIAQRIWVICPLSTFRTYALTPDPIYLFIMKFVQLGTQIKTQCEKRNHTKIHKKYIMKYIKPYHKINF